MTLKRTEVEIERVRVTNTVNPLTRNPIFQIELREGRFLDLSEIGKSYVRSRIVETRPIVLREWISSRSREEWTIREIILTRHHRKLGTITSLNFTTEKWIKFPEFLWPIIK